MAIDPNFPPPFAVIVRPMLVGDALTLVGSIVQLRQMPDAKYWSLVQRGWIRVVEPQDDLWVHASGRIFVTEMAYGAYSRSADAQSRHPSLEALWWQRRAVVEPAPSSTQGPADRSGAQLRRLRCYATAESLLAALIQVIDELWKQSRQTGRPPTRLAVADREHASLWPESVQPSRKQLGILLVSHAIDFDALVEARRAVIFPTHQ